MKALAKVYYYSFGVVAIAGIGLLGWALFFCWGQSYADFTSTILELVNKLDWRDYFETAVLPPARFELARWLLIFLSLFYLLGLMMSYRKWPQAASSLAKISQALAQSFARGWQGLRPWQLASLLLLATLFLARTIWHIYYYALDYDEAWTYNHFTSKGMLISMISPNNNHIFYTILASWADWLPIPSKWAIRLPALLAGGLAFSLFFVFIRKTLGIAAALVSLSYFAFSSGMNFYSLLGRGYGWQLVFGLLMTGATYQLLMEKDQRRWKLIYFLAFCLGIYSNPTFLYLGAGLMCLYFLKACKKRARLWSFIKLHLLLASILIVLHLPLLLTNGLKVLLDATENTAGASSEAMLYYLHRVVDWIFWGRGSLLFWAYLGILFLVLILRFMGSWNKSQKIIFSIAYLQLVLPFAYALISWTQPPYRIWVYLVVFVGMLLALFIKKVWGNQVQIIVPLLVLISGLSFYASETHYFLNWSANFDKEAKKMANLLLKNKKLDNCYSFARYDKPLLEFYFLDAERSFDCWMPFEASKDYRKFDAEVYDALLLDVEDYQPTAEDWRLIEYYNYQLIYENERVKLYLSPEFK